MKTRHFLSLALSGAILAHATAYAAAPGPASEQTSAASSAATASGHPGDPGRAALAGTAKRSEGGKSSDLRRSHGQASLTNHSPSRGTMTKPNHQVLNNRQRTQAGNTMALRQPNLARPTGAGMGGAMPDRAIYNPKAVRVSSTARPAAPSINPVRHRGANPPLIAGPMNSNRRNNGAIDGSRMKRKP